jgi:hypothetical protein
MNLFELISIALLALGCLLVMSIMGAVGVVR